MDDTGILSFSSPRQERENVEAHPSPTLELLYAYHRLLRHSGEDAERTEAATRPFETLFRTLTQNHPELLADIRARAGSDANAHRGYELFVLALEFGYVSDEDPARFFEALPDLPARFLARPGEEVASDRMGDAIRKSVRSNVERLAEPAAAQRLSSVLERLWAVLEPAWDSEGRAAVEEACEHFMAAYREKGDVLGALPAHHFAQFEASTEKIRAAQAREHVEAIPLYFASQGGFMFHLHDAYYIGFGVQVEQAFAHTEARVQRIAQKMKAFADPTRLMLVALLASYGRLTPTVGDLAAQLGVSQPTVSGHLRLLRDAGLVRLEKEGTKSFYHLQLDAALEPLEELTSLLDRRET